jgi:long-chain acyl-CoA synthetase
VVTIQDDSGLHKPVAFVVAEDVTEDELKQWALARLEPYKHPRRVVFLGELPRTHLGKVDRGSLKGLV